MHARGLAIPPGSWRFSWQNIHFTSTSQQIRIDLPISCCPVTSSPGQPFLKIPMPRIPQHKCYGCSTYPAKPSIPQELCLKCTQAFCMLLEGHTQTQSSPGILSCIPKEKLQTTLYTPKCFCFFCVKSNIWTCSRSGTVEQSSTLLERYMIKKFFAPHYPPGHTVP